MIKMLWADFELNFLRSRAIDFRMRSWIFDEWVKKEIAATKHSKKLQGGEELANEVYGQDPPATEVTDRSRAVVTEQATKRFAFYWIRLDFSEKY